MKNNVKKVRTRCKYKRLFESQFLSVMTFKNLVFILIFVSET